MIQTLTNLKILDNSGVKKAHCIKILKNKKMGTIGDYIIISVKALKKFNLKLQKKQILKALIINTKKEQCYKDASIFKFDQNQIILLKNSNTLLGTRILGIMPKFLRKKNLIKLLTQSLYLI